MRLPDRSDRETRVNENCQFASWRWRGYGRNLGPSQHPARSTQYLHVSVALLAILLAPAAFADSSIRFLNPNGLFRPSTFSQVAVTKGDTVVYISGQTARDEKSNVVGAGNVQKQAEQVFANLRIAVEAAGGSMADVAKITTYVVGLKPDDRIWIGELVKKNFPTPPAHTLVGISALAVPELLIEVEAVAVID